jgi:hypothetical protein
MRLTQRIKNEVKEQTRSIYRMNAGSADCYAFYLCHTDKGKLDFGGGFDWSHKLVDKNSDYLYMLETGEFRKL